LLHEWVKVRMLAGLKKELELDVGRVLADSLFNELDFLLVVLSNCQR
jgi:hypothetical protein